MKPLFCFIDDADFELDNFREHAAPAFKRVEFVYASTFAGAVKALDGRRPLLFLLDIFGGVEGHAPGAPPPREDLSRLLCADADLDGMYGDLERGGGGEAANRFLRLLHARVGQAHGAFNLAAKALGQSGEYGLGNLAAVRDKYPWAVAVAYSRKASYADASAMCLAGADGAWQKPQGEDDKAIAEATRRQAKDLAEAAYVLVCRRLVRLAGPQALRLCLEANGTPLAEAVLEGLKHLAGFGPGLAHLGPPKGSPEEAAESIRQVRLEDLDLADPDLGMVLALKDWLSSLK